MKKAIFTRFCFVVSVALILMLGISSFLFANLAREQTQQEMLRLLRVMAESYPGDGTLQDFAKLHAQNAGELRITVIAPDGTVLADSSTDPSEMENHAGRQEVKEAIRSGTGVYQRKSLTLGQSQLYTAYRLPDGNILRASKNFAGILTETSYQLPALLTAMAVALLVSFFLSQQFSAGLTQPFRRMASALDRLKQGETLSFPEDDFPYDELNQIGRQVSSLAQEIQRSASKLDNEREKVAFILDNMEEGLVLLNEKQEILTVNRSAKAFFSCQEEISGLHLCHLVSNTKVGDAVTEALTRGKSRIFDLTLPDNRIVSIHITQVTGDFIRHAHQNVGVILLIIDVTSDRISYQLRQQFFSNASHELKTPITSVQGFAELLESGMIADPEKQREYLARIIKESKRMANLINDILMISRLEAGIREEEYAPVQLKEICEEICQSLAPQAGSQNIQMEVVGSDGWLTANRDQMHELAANLISNAVKYNKENGQVKVTLTETPSKVKLKVADTGIGIPPESQGRIFERFYRVDKGRSRRIGGTGLGLSIVKHIVSAYGGEITLRSVEHEGTTISVTLPKKKSPSELS